MPAAKHCFGFGLTLVGALAAGCAASEPVTEVLDGGATPDGPGDTGPADATREGAARDGDGAPWPWRLTWRFEGRTVAEGCAAAGAQTFVEVVLEDRQNKRLRRERVRCDRGEVILPLATETVAAAHARLLSGDRVLSETAFAYGDVHDARSILLTFWYPGAPGPAALGGTVTPCRPADERERAVQASELTVDGSQAFVKVDGANLGCAPLSLTMCQEPAFIASRPMQAVLRLRSVAPTAPECWAAEQYLIGFDLRPLIERYRAAHPNEPRELGLVLMQDQAPLQLQSDLRF